MLKLQDAIGRELCTHPQSQSNVDRGDVLSLIRIQSLERTPGYPDQKSGTRPDKFVRDRDIYYVVHAHSACVRGYHSSATLLAWKTTIIRCRSARLRTMMSG
ncbi:hypothetical protein SCLCIDRAFT_1209295 [Scleroderma citrinum Foug A]|uniref:Uncharacterized protein n=1 Tax=Scleroderma citrinum Foug A TaxID=1036808 RepID=A0A0C3EJR8_9AGAM|nr:hypothetical protein SCLCIDRAFT_1209295 [Scleroderma citrinum Foug A]